MAAEKKILSDERHFILTAFKYIFEKCEYRFPDNMQESLKEIENNPCNNFTKQVLELMTSFCDNLRNMFKDDFTFFDENEIFRNKHHLRMKFSHRDFLMFITVYALKCCCQTPNFDYNQVCKDIESIFPYFHKHGSWTKMKSYTFDCHLVEERYKVTYQRKVNSAESILEKTFVILLFDHVFKHYDVDLPQYLKLTPDHVELYSSVGLVTANVDLVLDNILVMQSVKYVSCEYNLFETYHYSNKLMYFEPKDYLKYAALCAHKAVMRYLECDYYFTVKTFHKLVEILQFVREDGLYSSLEIMNEAAISIIAEERMEAEKENIYIHDYEETVIDTPPKKTLKCNVM